MDDMTIEFDETTQCYKIPVTGSVGIFRATVTRLFKKDGLLHVTVGYIPTQSSDDSILNNLSDTPTKYMDYLFSRQSGSWYLTGLTDSETKPESADSAASAAEPAPLAESEVNVPSCHRRRFCRRQRGRQRRCGRGCPCGRSCGEHRASSESPAA